MLILSADIGGTNSRIQINHLTATGKIVPKLNRLYPSHKFANFIAILDDFFTNINYCKEEISALGVCAAGPIVDGAIKFTNLSWNLNRQDLINYFNLEQVYLLNDFEAIGYGLEIVAPEEVWGVANEFAKNRNIKAYVGAGTGTGVGFITFTADDYKVHPSEGGHIDFAPMDESQVQLWDYLHKKHQRISVERVLSGIGITNIYRFLTETSPTKNTENTSLNLALDDLEDGANIICDYALHQQNATANRTLEIFFRILGNFAGNVALTILPYGGMYLAGGIIPKILPTMIQGQNHWHDHIFFQSLLSAYKNKGRLTYLMDQFPINIIGNTNIGLIGAANFVRRKLNNLQITR